MLIGQNLGRSHHTGLKAVVNGEQHRHQGDECLAAAHVALQQPVHLLSALHIGMDLTQHALLCTGQPEGQIITVKRMKGVAHSAKGNPAELVSPKRCRTQDVELNVKQLIKFKTLLRRLQRLCRFGEVYVLDSFRDRHHLKVRHDGFGQCFGNLPVERREQRILHILDGA